MALTNTAFHQHVVPLERERLAQTALRLAVRRVQLDRLPEEILSTRELILLHVVFAYSSEYHRGLLSGHRRDLRDARVVLTNCFGTRPARFHLCEGDVLPADACGGLDPLRPGSSRASFYDDALWRCP